MARLQRPFMVGEWHFGAFDGGLPGAGLSAVKDQAERGKVFRVYLEHAAALPWLVGAHWFNMYDRPALYATVNGENANTRRQYSCTSAIIMSIHPSFGGSVPSPGVRSASHSRWNVAICRPRRCAVCVART